MSDVVKSVQFNPPPAGPIAQAAAAFALDAAQALKPTESGGVFGVVTRREDGTLTANAAIVVRKGEHLAIAGWIAKSWDGEPVGGFSYGAGGKFTW